MNRSTYRFISLSGGDQHTYKYLVFDIEDQLHFQLTLYANEACTFLASGTVRAYLYAVLPFFAFLTVDASQVRSRRQWDSPPEDLRRAISDYLNRYHLCKVREHRLGFQLVERTEKTPSSTGIFLSALKLFYRIMREKGAYIHKNPLLESVPNPTDVINSITEEDSEYPRMPDVSGVAPPVGVKRRLSDSYYRISGEEWVPQVIDDPTLFSRVLRGGRKVAGWKLRETCVTRILFESGCRISEVVGLTLDDWFAKNFLNGARAFSKGSHGVRVKTLRFSQDTAKLLRRYFDFERRKIDANGYSLNDYLRAHKLGRTDLKAIPLFLTSQRTQLSPKTFREIYWKPACRAAGIVADIHQARHWFVTFAVRAIYESSPTEAEVRRKLHGLIEYMKWRAGEDTLRAYNHYFDTLEFGDVQDSIHARMDDVLRRRLKTHSVTPPSRLISEESLSALNRESPESDSFDFNFLMNIGGKAVEVQ